MLRVAPKGYIVYWPSSTDSVGHFVPVENLQCTLLYSRPSIADYWVSWSHLGAWRSIWEVCENAQSEHQLCTTLQEADLIKCSCRSLAWWGLETNWLAVSLSLPARSNPVSWQSLVPVPSSSWISSPSSPLQSMSPKYACTAHFSPFTCFFVLFNNCLEPFLHSWLNQLMPLSCYSVMHWRPTFPGIPERSFVNNSQNPAGKGGGMHISGMGRSHFPDGYQPTLDKWQRHKFPRQSLCQNSLRFRCSSQDQRVTLSNTAKISYGNSISKEPCKPISLKLPKLFLLLFSQSTCTLRKLLILGW